MGNCFPKVKKPTVEIARRDFTVVKGSSTTSVVNLYGSSTGSLTAFARIALRYKSLSVHFISTDTFVDDGRVTLQFGSENVSATAPGTLLGFIDLKFPQPPALVVPGNGSSASLIAKVVELQHRSLSKQLEKVVMWTNEIETRRERRGVDLRMGNPKMEIRKLCARYSLLHEVLVEHAQMEERVIFPLLEMADRGACKNVIKDHARDFPIMNGIKENIKSIGVMDVASPDYHEALSNLLQRLKLLQENCKEHFAEEEKELMPLIMGLELSRVQEITALKKCFEVMQGTHESHLFDFLIEGLLPGQVMQYLELMFPCKDERQIACLLQRIID